METKKVTTGVAAVGVLAGVTGLVLTAIPSSAGAAPALPTVSPQDLVTSVLAAKPTAFDGTVSATSNLGLPIPGLAQDSDGAYAAKVYSDAQGRHRLATTEQGGGQHTVVEDGTTLWTYDSTKHEASRAVIPQQAKDKMRAEASRQNPAALATELIGTVQRSSTVSIDGTALVADRPAYELVLTPKPTEKTLVREVRVAVDAATRMPLRFEVFGNGSADPAIEVGFSALHVGAQDPALFQFTPPAGTKVTTVDPSQHQRPKPGAMGPMPTVTGDGWDTVVTATLPKDALAKAGQSTGGPKGRFGGGDSPTQLINKFSKPVSGAFGTGRSIQTSVGTLLITSDGRVAAGLVPEQVLEKALTR